MVIQNIIEKQIVQDGHRKQSRRPYLSMSACGNPCKRAQWYDLHWATAIAALNYNVYMLFDRGHREEETILRILREIGIVAHGEQTEIVAAFGFAKGHVDALLDNVPEYEDETLLGEFKTHNDKSFTHLEKKGVYESKKEHYMQMQRYMQGLGLKHALYYAVNKNNDKIYTEIVPYSERSGDYLVETELAIVESDNAPPQASNDPRAFVCMFCDHKPVCHEGVMPDRNCRTCERVTMCEGGIWQCKVTTKDLGLREQQEGCDKYKPHSGFFTA